VREIIGGRWSTLRDFARDVGAALGFWLVVAFVLLILNKILGQNTTLRTIGRPAELRDRLFTRSLAVRTLAPLAAPERVFAGLPGVEGWQAQDGSYLLAVSDARAAAPAVTRALVGAGADVLSIAEVRHSLEDVYLELIGDDVEVRRP